MNKKMIPYAIIEGGISKKEHMREFLFALAESEYKEKEHEQFFYSIRPGFSYYKLEDYRSCWKKCVELYMESDLEKGVLREGSFCLVFEKWETESESDHFFFYYDPDNVVVSMEPVYCPSYKAYGDGTKEYYNE